MKKIYQLGIMFLVLLLMISVPVKAAEEGITAEEDLPSEEVIVSKEDKISEEDIASEEDTTSEEGIITGEEITVPYSGEMDLQEGNFGNSEEYSGESKTSRGTLLTLEETYEQAIINRETTIDVSGYLISVRQADAVLSNLRNKFPQYFYAVLTNYSYYSNYPFVAKIYIKYTGGKTEIAAYESAVAQALAQVDDSMSDVNKALVLHDYLALNCAYDMDNYNADTLPDTVYQSYGVLVLNSAVCQGYALAYQDLLTRLGISCVTVGSDGMNHAWNIVKLGSSYYHVDVTWDDPTWDTTGQVFHDFFLISDTAIQDTEHNHYGWEINITANNTQYENGFWLDSIAGIYRSNDSLYYIDVLGNLTKHSMSTNAESVLTTITDSWLDPEDNGSAFAYCLAKLVLANDQLYYNTTQAIYSIELDGSSDTKIEELNNSNDQIYGLGMKNSQLVYTKRAPTVEQNEVFYTVSDFSLLTTGIYLNQNTMTLAEKAEGKLTALSLPNNLQYNDVTWSSSNPNIVSVDQKGTITGKALGTAVITAKNAANNYTASCQVSVGHAAAKQVVEKAATCAAKGICAYRCSACNELFYREEIAKTDDHSYGSWTTVKAATVFQKGSKQRTCTLCNKVQTASVAKKKAKVTLNAKSAPLQVKKSTTSIKVASYSKGDSVKSWKSSNKKVAKVNKKTGKITAKKVGTAYITVTMKSGASAKCKIKVQKKAVSTTKITLDKKKLTLKKGKTYSLTVSRVPVTATDKITYKSSNTKVAKVSKNGTIKARKKGKATITVTTKNGKSKKCKVTVK